MLFDKTGADAVRFFFLINSRRRLQILRQRGDGGKKPRIFRRLLNSYNFFAMYADKVKELKGYKSPAKETELVSDKKRGSNKRRRK
jgi:isoleucyl-tRNA synthetase